MTTPDVVTGTFDVCVVPLSGPTPSDPALVLQWMATWGPETEQADGVPRAPQ